MGAESANKRTGGPLAGSIRAMIGWLWHLLVDHGPEPRRALAVIAWWELRRPIFNGVVFAGGCLTLLLTALTIKAWTALLNTPFFFVLWVGILFVLANLAYTGGWVTELLVRLLIDHGKPLVTKFAKRAFVAGIIFSFVLMALPGFHALVMFLIGHPVMTPQGSYTEIPPITSNVVGIYAPIDESLERIDRAGFDSSLTFSIELYPDSTCRLTNFPSGFHPALGESQRLSTCDGIWRLTRDDWDGEYHWYVTVYTNNNEPPPLGARYRYCWRFHLRNDEPPYELFEWVGDPYAWDYIAFRQATPTPGTTASL